MAQSVLLSLFALLAAEAQELFLAANVSNEASAIRSTVGGLAGLSFHGKGSREANPSGDPKTVKYHMSSGFQGQMCGSCKDKHCWGSQGVSKYGNYITRSFYEKDALSKCSNPDATYYAISVMKRDDATYSNILVQNGQTQRSCHTGGHVLRTFGETFWFFVACTDHVSIFSEESIQTVDNTVQGKTFGFFVSGADVTILENGQTSFSYISRVDSSEEEFYSGRYDASVSSAEALNLQRIRLSNAGGGWSLEVLETFGVKSGVAMKVQGATMINGYMILVTSQHIRRCTVEPGNVLNSCMQQCQIPGTCAGTSCCDSSNLVLQDAETDGDGRLYIGTEFDCDGRPFFEIPNMGEGAAANQDQDCFPGW